MPSCYFPQLTQDTKIAEIESVEHHHLIHVLRHRVGDTIKLNSGKGDLAEGLIKSIETNRTIVEIIRIDQYSRQKPTLAIAFSLLKNKNDEWLLEKTTELGVSEYWPILTDYTVRKLSANTVNGFRKAALRAIKQCDNPFLPVINDAMQLRNAISSIVSNGLIPVVADEKRPDRWLDTLDMGQSYCFIIGPEGGFSNQEFKLLQEFNAIEIRLSSLILRAETAAIAATAQFMLMNKS